MPVQEEQETLSQITRLRSSGQSYAKIADQLNSEGLPAKRGGRWHAMSVRSVERTALRMATPAGH